MTVSIYDIWQKNIYIDMGVFRTIWTSAMQPLADAQTLPGPKTEYCWLVAKLSSSWQLQLQLNWVSLIINSKHPADRPTDRKSFFSSATTGGICSKFETYAQWDPPKVIYEEKNGELIKVINMINIIIMLIKVINIINMIIWSNWPSRSWSKDRFDQKIDLIKRSIWSEYQFNQKIS